MPERSITSFPDQDISVSACGQRIAAFGAAHQAIAIFAAGEVAAILTGFRHCMRPLNGQFAPAIKLPAASALMVSGHSQKEMGGPLMWHASAVAGRAVLG